MKLTFSPVRAFRQLTVLIAAPALLAGLLAVTPASAAPGDRTAAGQDAAVVSVQQANGPLSATDALGRELPLADQAPARRDRTVGVFYALWHGTNDHREYKNVFNNTATLATDPDAAATPDSGAWPTPGHFAYWGEPLYGYYRSDDEWVMRRHLELLAEADVDYLLLDTSNNELYKGQVALLMRLIVELQAQGVKAPQVVFMTHTDATPKMDELYRTFYAPDAPYRYPSTWFYWEGKPLILGASPSAQVREFFSFRVAQWPNEPQTENGWDWISFDRPQRANLNPDGSIEQMAVSSAQNSGSSSIFSYTALEARDEVPSRSKNWHDGAEDESEDALLHGYNFQEEWDHVIAQDPESILVLEWNEWIAGNWAARATDLPVFYDVVDQRWNRDLEMMKGGFGDAYYLQLVANIRRYKGVDPTAGASGPRTITLDGPASQWNDVTPVFGDPAGDTAHRDHAGVDQRTYVNTTGRNDIVTSQVSYDDEFLYFRAATRDPLTPYTDDNWMTLYLDVDGNASNGWSGYDFAVNRDPSAATTTLERAGNGWEWTPVADDLSYRADGNQLVIRVPRALLTGLGDVPRVEFSWWDNGTTTGDPMDAYLLGDKAPASRFDYVFDAAAPTVAQFPDLPEVSVPQLPDDGYHRIEDGAPTEAKAFIGPAASDWVIVPDSGASGGSTSYAVNPQARTDQHYRNYVRAAFNGSSVRWVAPTGPDGVQAEVFIDGLSQGRVTQYAAVAALEQVIFERYSLPDDRHEIMVVWEPQSGRYSHDYFEYGVGNVTAPAVPAGENAAHTAWATGSSFAPAKWYPTNPAQATDGDPSTLWRAAGDTQERLTLTFGRPTQVSRIEVEPGPGGLRNVVLQARMGGDWVTVQQAPAIEAATEITIDPVTASAVRLTADGVDGPVEVAELAVRSGAPTGPDDPSWAWEFTRDAEGWTSEGAPGFGWTAGSVGSSTTAAGTRLLSPTGLGLNAADYGTLKLRLRNGTASTQGAVRFQPEGATELTGSVPIRLTGTKGSYAEYAVDLSTHPDWSGTIDRIAIELGNDAAGGAVALDFARFAPDNAVAAWHFRADAEGWTASAGPQPVWRDGAIAAATGGERWQVDSPSGLRADITNHSVVKVRVQGASPSTAVQVFFATGSAGFADGRSMAMSVAASGDGWQDYEADLGSMTGWKGLLDQLRIRVTPGEADELAISSVRVEPFVITQLGNVSAWEFTESTDGWGGAGGIDGFGWMEGGYVGGGIVHPDPQIYSPDKLWVELAGLPSIRLRFQVETTGTEGTLYYSTDASPTFSQDKSVPIPLHPDAEGIVDITLDMTGQSGWRGLLKQLRFDPVEGGGGKGSFQLDFVRLQDFTLVPVTVATNLRVPPVLPATVTRKNASGTTTQVPVVWDAVPPEAYAKVGVFTVRGVTEDDLAVVATVTVNDAIPAWEFDTDLQGWGSPFGIEHFRWAQGGYLEGVNIWYGDAQFFSPDSIGADLSRWKLVRIGLQNKTSASKGTLFFSTTDQPSFDGVKSLPIPLVPNDDQVREYVLDFSEVPGWSGLLKQFRFDPADDVTAGDFLLDYVRLDEKAPSVDVTALEAAMAAAQAVDAGDYTTSSWATADLASALAAGQAVLDDPKASQASVDQATDALDAAVGKLIRVGDPTVLGVLIDAADALSGKLGGFTDQSAAALEDALAAAKAVHTARLDRSQAELDAAAEALQGALDGLVVKAPVVNKAVLQSAYDEIVGLSNADRTYSEASWAKLQSALRVAKPVLDDPAATQAQVDGAVSRLVAALAGLTPAPSQPAAPVVTKLKLNQTQLSLVKGRSLQLEEGVYYDDQRASYSGEVTWTSSNPKVATVTSSGKVKARKLGTAVITVTTTQANPAGQKLSVKLKVTVVKSKPRSKVTKVTASVPRSMTVGQLAYVTGRYSSAKATGIKVTYATTKSRVVAIDKAGRLVAKGKGTAYVKVSAGGRTARYKVTVR
ncbi:MAG: Ig-like domain-containing protein [Propionicimonas sp.]